MSANRPQPLSITRPTSRAPTPARSKSRWPFHGSPAEFVLAAFITAVTMALLMGYVWFMASLGR